MSLEDAAAGDAQRAAPRPPPTPSAMHAAGFARFFHLSEEALRRDKEAREASRQAAFARGLDAAERRPPASGPGLFRRASTRRMDPFRHARNLLLETALPLREIVRLTGLTIWQVVALKLKLRLEAGRPPRS